jgi:hypothetical protein
MVCSWVNIAFTIILLDLLNLNKCHRFTSQEYPYFVTILHVRVGQTISLQSMY